MIKPPFSPIRNHEDPDNKTGVAKRRYQEAQAFGLYQTGDTYIEAEQDLKMLTEHRASILKYEQKYGTDPDGAGPTKPTNSIAAANAGAANPPVPLAAPVSPVQSLTVAFNAEAELLVTYLNNTYTSVLPHLGVLNDAMSGALNVRSTDIYVAASDADILAGFATSADKHVSALAGDLGHPDQAAAPHILIGTGNGDELIGGVGTDILIAGDGSEILKAGSGPDTIISGSGNDTIIASIGNTIDVEIPMGGPGSAVETLIDNSGLNSLEAEGDSLAGVLTPQAYDAWVSGGLTYTFQTKDEYEASHGGAAAPLNFSPNAMDPYVGVMEISAGPSHNEVDIWGFNLKTASDNPIGFDGIVVPKSIVLAPGALASGLPGFVGPDSSSTTAMTANGIQTFTVSLATPNSAPQSVTIHLSGAASSEFEVVDVETMTVYSFVGGDATLPWGAGDSNRVFQLIPISNSSAPASFQLTATASDPATSSPLTINYLADPTAGVPPVTTTSTVSGTFNSGTQITSYLGDGGNDYIPSTSANNLINATNSVNDSIIGGSGNNTVIGGSGNNVITLSGATDWVTVYGGNSTLNGGAGHDGFFGGNGNSLLVGNGGTDLVLLGNGSNQVFARGQLTLGAAIAQSASSSRSGLQGDALAVGNGNSTVVGGTGDDIVLTGSGNDIVVLGPGNDTVLGGESVTSLSFGWTATIQADGSIGLTNINATGQGFTNPFSQPYNGNHWQDGSLFGSGSDTIFAGSGASAILLANGNNYVDAGSGNTSVFGGMGNDTIVAGSGTQIVRGGGGNTVIYGGSGASTLIGGDGNNTIVAGSGNSTIYSEGGPGTTWAGQDLETNYVYGGSGNDVIHGASAGAGHETLVAGSGNTTIFGGTGTELIEGGAGNVSLTGGTGNDTIVAGGAGRDTLVGIGSATSTTVIYGGAGQDEIFGGRGANVLYAGGGGTTLTPTQVVASGSDASSTTTIFGGSGVDQLFGGAGSTVIYAGDGGTAAAPVTVQGGAGTTTVYGGAGVDLIIGGTGAGVLYAGDGGAYGASTSVIGAGGATTLYGGIGYNLLEDTVSGADLIIGGSSADSLIGVGADTLVAGTGDDVLQNAGGALSIQIGATFGNDTVFGTGGTNNFSFATGLAPTDFSGSMEFDAGGAPVLVLAGDGGSLQITGGLTGSIGTIGFADSGAITEQAWLASVAGDQTLTGANGRLILNTDASASVSWGQFSGSDTVSSWGDNAQLTGSSNFTGGTVYAAGAGDSIVGGGGFDAITAAGAADTVRAGTVGANITLKGTGSVAYGSAATDVLTASGSADTLVGGTGVETFIVNSASDVIVTTAVAAASELQTSVTYTLPANLTTLVLTGSANISGTGNGANDFIYGGSGLDTLISGAGIDTLYGGTGNTTFVVNNAADVAIADYAHPDGTSTQNTISSSVSYTLPAYIDTLVLTGSANLTGTAVFDSDTLVSNSGIDTLIGAAGNDVFVVNNAADVVQDTHTDDSDTIRSAVSFTLPANVDALVLTGTAAISGTANAGNDSLIGNAGTSTLIGGVGSDTLVAGSALTTMIGGSGNTTFVVNNSADFIQDSAPGAANVALSSVSFTLPTNVNSLMLTGASNIVGTGNAANDTITGGAGIDTLIAGAGIATLVGGTGNTTFVVNNTADVVQDGSTATSNSVQASVSFTLPTNVNQLLLTGAGGLVGTANSANDSLIGNAGASTLVGGIGLDTLIAGSGVTTLVSGTGNTTFVVNNAADVVRNVNSTNSDTVQSSVSFSLAANVNTLVLTGSGAISGTANSGNDSLIGNGGAHTLFGGVGADTLVAGSGLATLVGGTGKTTFVVNNAADVIQANAAAASNTVLASFNTTAGTNVTKVVLTGTGNLSATANNHGNTLVSNSGVDTLTGGTGIDSFVVNNAADVVQETVVGSQSTVATSVSYTLPTNIAYMTLTGTGSIAGTGNSLQHTLVGGAGIDTLVAGAGLAVLVGGSGNTTFVVNNVADSVASAYETNSDTISSSVNYTLPANVNTIVLTGANALKATSNSGNDTLVSNSGVDTLVGTSGNETFVVNNSSDVVQDSSATAFNTATASVSFTLPTNVNTLVLTGSSNLVGTANAGNDSITGNAGSDTLVGGTGLDTLVAGSGIATLIGGSGNTMFVVNNAADVVQDSFGGASNSLLASVSFTLPANVNALVLTGAANIMGTGNAANDTLTGGSGADTLIAGSGTDTLIGGAGNTVFVVNNVSDVVQDSSATTTNTIDSSVSYTLPANVNTLILTGSGNLTATGNAGNDTLVSNTGIDTLIGGTGNTTFVVSNAGDVVQDTSTTTTNAIQASVSYTLPVHVNSLILTGSGNLTGTANAANDTLTSNSGADTLVGGAGNDTFIVNNSADVIQDAFVSASNVALSAVTFVLPTNVNSLVLTGSGNITGTGNAGADVLTAGAGTDTLVAGTGIATMVGGTGNTTFVVNNTSDVVQDASTTTANTILSSVSYTAPTNVNTVVLTGSSNLTATANAANDTLVSNSGVDTLVGKSGNETFVINNSSDVLTDTVTSASNTAQASVSYTLPTNVNTLLLTGSGNLVGTGNAAHDTIVGGSGADTLVAGGGYATLVGGSGNTTFVVNNVSDVVTDAYFTATNTLQSSVSYTLPSNVDTLTFTGSGSLTGSGNSDFSNVLNANSGNDTLYGTAYNTTINGGTGADSLLAGPGQNVIYSGNGGTVSKATVVVGNAAGTDTYTQSTIYGGTGKNIIFGGPGSDLIVAGSGTTSVIAGSGFETVSGVAGISISDTYGTGSLLQAGGGAESITGTGFDTLVAGSGSDLLTGANGAGTKVTYEFNTGFGATTINGSSNGSNLVFGTGLAPSGLTISAGAGGSLVLSIGGGTATIANGMSLGIAPKNVSFVDSGPQTLVQLVQAHGPAQQTVSGGAVTYVLAAGNGLAVSAGTSYLVDAYGNNDRVLGANGASIITYGAGDTVSSGGSSGIAVEGSGGLVNVAGNDVVTVDGDNATLVGGLGNAQFTVNNATTVIQVTAGAGSDSVLASVSFTLPANVAQMTLAGGSNALSGTSNTQGGYLLAAGDTDTLTGGSGHDTLEAAGHNDVLIGGSGVETFVLDNVTDTAQFSGIAANNTVQATFSYALPSTVNNLILQAAFAGVPITGTANSGNDSLVSFGDGISTLYGGAGTDTLVSAVFGGASTLVGGTGNTTFVVNNSGDVVIDSSGTAANVLQSSIDYALPANVNSLVLTGTSNLTGTANSANDSLAGNSGNDTLIAGVGNDTFTAGGGVDTFVFNTGYGHDQIVNPQNGDIIQFGAGITQANLTFTALLGASGTAPSLVISGAGGSVTVTGGLVPGALGGINIGGTLIPVQQLIAPSGRQTVTGSGGNLILSPNNSDSFTSGTGLDTVVAWGNTDTLTAGSGGALIYAGGTSDKVTGSAGNDTLVAIGATDTLVGGTGNETLVVNNASAVVSVGAGGHDTVLSSVTYTVPTNVQVMTLTGAGAIQATGNTLSDTITGNAGNCTLSAGSGADTFIAGSGNTLFVINSASDSVSSAFAAASDTVKSSVNYTLPTNVNNLILTGSSALTGTGNAGNDVITGNSGADTLTAGSGAATLIGGAGANVFVLNSASDVVVNSGNSFTDTIRSSANVTLTSRVAAVVLTGSANLTARDLGIGAVSIIGNTGSDTLVDAAGQDTLVAGTGVDTLISTGAGFGNTIFVVNNSADVLQAAPLTGSQVYSSVNFTLPTNIDNINLTGSGNVLATGNGDARNSLSTGTSTGADTLVAGSGADWLSSTAATATLVAGAGADTLYGVSGDTFVLNSGFGSDLIQESTPGTGSIQFGAGVAPSSLTVAVGLDNLGNAALLLQSGGSTATLGGAMSNIGYTYTFSGGGAQSLGQFLSQVHVTSSTVVGGSGNAILMGAASTALTGGSGNDTIYAGAASDTITAGSGNQVLAAAGTNDSIVGGATADTLEGFGTNDTLVGGSVADTMIGGGGATVMFVVNNINDKVQTQGTPGSDTISSSVNFTLPTNVNTLVLSGSGALKGTANNGNDTLISNTGIDTLVAGTGNDLFILNNSSDKVTVGGTHGNDTIQAGFTVNLTTLAPNAVNLLLTGSSALSGTGSSIAGGVLTANSGADTLTAGTAVVTMLGGTGNDVFVVNNASDVIQVASSSVNDTINSSVTYTLPTNVNTLVLTGSSALRANGNAANDYLKANTGADTLVAGNGTDTLESGTGVCSLVGGTGTDLFIVGNASDVVTEATSGLNDTINSSVTYTLPTNVSTLVLTGSSALRGNGNAANDYLKANTGADTLVAGNGADTLESGTGICSLVGGTGADLFIVNNASDVVTVATSGTNDTIQSSVTFTLPTNVQYLKLTGSSALTGTGNSITDLIVGNTGADTLTGGTGVAVIEGGTAGAQVLKALSNQAALIGGGAANTITGGAFKDFLAAGKAADTITGGATANVIAVNKGDGATVLTPTTSANNVLSLGAGIDTENLTFTKSGNNLILNDSVAGDSITFTNWYSASSNQTTKTLQVVEIASASYNAGGGDSLRNKPLEEFNFTSLVTAFNTAGNPANWALSNAMAADTIASSATQAYGGDLAYYFGLNGNLTGMNLSAAQSTLTNASFATALQTIDAWASISGGTGIHLNLVVPRPRGAVTQPVWSDGAIPMRLLGGYGRPGTGVLNALMGTPLLQLGPSTPRTITPHIGVPVGSLAAANPLRGIAVVSSSGLRGRIAASLNAVPLGIDPAAVSSPVRLLGSIAALAPSTAVPWMGAPFAGASPSFVRTIAASTGLPVNVLGRSLARSMAIVVPHMGILARMLPASELAPAAAAPGSANSAVRIAGSAVAAGVDATSPLMGAPLLTLDPSTVRTVASDTHIPVQRRGIPGGTEPSRMSAPERVVGAVGVANVVTAARLIDLSAVVDANTARSAAVSSPMELGPPAMRSVEPRLGIPAMPSELSGRTGAAPVLAEARVPERAVTALDTAVLGSVTTPASAPVQLIAPFTRVAPDLSGPLLSIPFVELGPLTQRTITPRADVPMRSVDARDALAMAAATADVPPLSPVSTSRDPFRSAMSQLVTREVLNAGFDTNRVASGFPGGWHSLISSHAVDEGGRPSDIQSAWAAMHETHANAAPGLSPVGGTELALDGTTTALIAGTEMVSSHGRMHDRRTERLPAAHSAP